MPYIYNGVSCKLRTDHGQNCLIGRLSIQLSDQSLQDEHVFVPFSVEYPDSAWVYYTNGGLRIRPHLARIIETVFYSVIAYLHDIVCCVCLVISILSNDPEIIQLRNSSWSVEVHVYGAYTSMGPETHLMPH